MTMHRYLHLPPAFLVVWIVATSACADDGTQALGPGSIHVITTTAGDDLDLGGYLIQVAGEEVPYLILVNDTVVMNNVDERAYTVSLTDLATNCSPDVGVQQVSATAGDTTEVLFHVSCTELPPASVDVTGTWDGTYDGRDLIDGIDRAGTIHFELVQSGDEVTGTVSSDGTKPYTATGRVSGNTLELFFVGWNEALISWDVRLTARGEVSGNAMSGTHSEMRGAYVGTWTATRQ